MIGEDDKIKLLWEATRGTFDIGSLDDFRTKLADPDKRNIFWKAASKEFDLGDYASFESKVAPAPNSGGSKKNTNEYSLNNIYTGNQTTKPIGETEQQTVQSDVEEEPKAQPLIGPALPQNPKRSNSGPSWQNNSLIYNNTEPKKPYNENIDPYDQLDAYNRSKSFKQEIPISTPLGTVPGINNNKDDKDQAKILTETTGFSPEFFDAHPWFNLTKNNSGNSLNAIQKLYFEDRSKAQQVLDEGDILYIAKQNGIQKDVAKYLQAPVDNDGHVNPESLSNNYWTVRGLLNGKGLTKDVDRKLSSVFDNVLKPTNPYIKDEWNAGYGKKLGLDNIYQYAALRNAQITNPEEYKRLLKALSTEGDVLPSEILSKIQFQDLPQSFSLTGPANIGITTGLDRLTGVQKTLDDLQKKAKSSSISDAYRTMNSIADADPYRLDESTDTKISQYKDLVKQIESAGNTYPLIQGYNIKKAIKEYNGPHDYVSDFANNILDVVKNQFSGVLELGGVSSESGNIGKSVRLYADEAPIEDRGSGMTIRPNGELSRIWLSINKSNVSDEEKNRRYIKSALEHPKDLIEANATDDRNDHLTFRNLLYNGASMVSDVIGYGLAAGMTGGTPVSLGLSIGLDTQQKTYSDLLASGDPDALKKSRQYGVAAGAVAMLGGGALSKYIPGSVSGKFVNGLSEDLIENIASGNSRTQMGLISAAKNVGKEAATMGFVFGGGQTFANAIADKYNGEAVDWNHVTENAVASTAHMIGSSWMFLLKTGATSLYKRGIEPAERESLYFMAKNPDFSRYVLKESLNNGSIDQRHYDIVNASIDKIVELKSKIPIYNESNSGKLTEEERSKLLVNLFIKENAKERIKFATPDQEANLKSVVEKMDYKNSSIINRSKEENLEAARRQQNVDNERRQNIEDHRNYYAREKSVWKELESLFETPVVFLRNVRERLANGKYISESDKERFDILNNYETAPESWKEIQDRLNEYATVREEDLNNFYNRVAGYEQRRSEGHIFLTPSGARALYDANTGRFDYIQLKRAALENGIDTNLRPLEIINKLYDLSVKSEARGRERSPALKSIDDLSSRNDWAILSSDKESNNELRKSLVDTYGEEQVHEINRSGEKSYLVTGITNDEAEHFSRQHKQETYINSEGRVHIDESGIEKMKGDILTGDEAVNTGKHYESETFGDFHPDIEEGVKNSRTAEDSAKSFEEHVDLPTSESYDLTKKLAGQLKKVWNPLIPHLEVVIDDYRDRVKQAYDNGELSALDYEIAKKANGWYDDKRDIVYLNPSRVKSDTAIHEFGHLYWKMMKNHNHALHARAMKYADEHFEEYGGFGLGSAYSNNSYDDKAEEWMIKQIGKAGSDINMSSKSAKALWNDFWNSIKSLLGLKSDKFRNQDLANMPLDKFVSLMAKDVLRGGKFLYDQVPFSNSSERVKEFNDVVEGSGFKAQTEASDALRDERKEKSKVLDIAQTVESWAKSKLTSESSAEDRIQRFYDDAIQELRYFLGEHDYDSGLDWYTKKVDEYRAKLHDASRIAIEKGEMPKENDLRDENNMKLFAAVLSLSSLGVNPKENVPAAFNIWKKFDRQNGVFVKYQPGQVSIRTNIKNSAGYEAPSGKIVRETSNAIILQDKYGKEIKVLKKDIAEQYEVVYKNKDGEEVKKVFRKVKKNPTNTVYRSGKSEIKINNENIISEEQTDTGVLSKGWTTRGNIVEVNLSRLEKVIQDQGSIENAIKWLDNKHAIVDLRNYNSSVPDILGKKGKKDPQGERTGAFILGEKLGSFYQNVTGIPSELTMDLWWSRTWNRMMGTLITEGKKGKLFIQETPRTDVERNIMREAANRLAKDLGLQVHELQATLWYMEQQLYKNMGASVESYSFVDGVNKILKGYGKSKSDLQPERYGIDRSEIDERRQDAAARAYNKIYGENSTTGEGGTGEGRGEGTTPKFQADDTEIIDGFYSPIEDRINTFKQPKASAQKWKDIVGVKSDEAVYSGVAEWLGSMKPDQQLSKEEVLKFMKDNRIEIKEVRLGEKELATQWEPMKEGGFKRKIGDRWTFIREHSDGSATGEGPSGFVQRFSSVDEAKDHYDSSSIKVTQYGVYQLPGGENYKEVLITLPQKRTKNKVGEVWMNRAGVWFAEINGKKIAVDQNGEDTSEEDARNIAENYLDNSKTEFQSSHFDEPNIIVHLRMNTRTDANGKKVLFLEEVQSDWGQKGKREGFSKSENESKFKELQDNVAKATQEFKSIKNELYRQYELKKKEGETESQLRERDNDYDSIAKLYAPAKLRQFQARYEFNLFQRKNRDEVPTAPYVTNTNAWVKLGMKVALKEAVKQGADRIAWTTGEQQNERYDLSKQVDEIQYNDNGDGTYNYSATKNGREVGSTENADIKKVESELGKEVADKMLNSVGKDVEGDEDNIKSLTGDNLRVGGKGMKAFYGDAENTGIVGNVAKALVKELTGKEGGITVSNIDTSHPLDKTYKGLMDKLEGQKGQPAIEITPELRQAVQGGIPKFSVDESKDLKEFSIGYAPFREGNITDISKSSEAFDNSTFKKWKQMSTQFANDIGIEILDDNNSVGIYSETSENAEASAILNVRGTEDKIDLFCALMGTLAPDSQHSVMKVEYNKNGKNQTRFITLDGIESVKDFVKNRKKYGLDDVSLIPENNSVFILDTGNFNQNKFIKDYGRRIKEHESRKGNASFIGEYDYREILSREWDSNQGHDNGASGKNISDAITLATQRAGRLGRDYDALSESEKKKSEQFVRDYVEENKADLPEQIPTKVRKVDSELSIKIKDVYDQLPVDDSNNPAVIRAYQASAKEIDKQFEFLTKKIGIKVEFTENDPYENSDALFDDIMKNKRMLIFKGGEPHPFLGDSSKDSNGLTATEKLRAVHDYFGHFVERNQFGKVGEERAWVAHSKMFSEEAQKALTTETRGQNSWVNFSGKNDESLDLFRRGKDLISQGKITEGNKLIAEGKKKFEFATQKVAILPDFLNDWTIYEDRNSNAKFSVDEDAYNEQIKRWAQRELYLGQDYHTLVKVLKDSGINAEDAHDLVMKAQHRNELKGFETGVNRDTINKENIERGLDEVVKYGSETFGEWWNKGELITQKREMFDFATKVIANPRVLKPEEVAALIRYKVDLYRQRHELMYDLGQSTGSESNLLADDLDVLEKKIDAVNQAATLAGSMAGKALVAFKMMSDMDYTVSNYASQYKAITGRSYVPQEVMDKLKANEEKLNRAQKDLERLQKNYRQLSLNIAMEKEVSNTSKTKQNNEPKQTINKDQFKADAKAAFEKFKASKIKASVEDVPDEVKKIIRKYFKELVNSGERDPKDIVNQIYDDIIDGEEGITKDDVSDIISGYGETKKANQDTIAIIERDLRAQIRIQRAIEDVENGMLPKKTGFIHDEPSDVVRGMRQKLDELLKDSGLEDYGSEEKYKTALDAAKKRTQNRIDDLKRMIEKNEKAQKRGSIDADQELIDLRNERDRQQGIYDEKFGKTKLTNSQLISIAESNLERAIKNIKLRIEDAKKGKFEGKEASNITSDKILKLKNILKNYQDDFQELRKAAGEIDKQRIEIAKKSIAKRKIPVEEKLNKINKLKEEIASEKNESTKKLKSEELDKIFNPDKKVPLYDKDLIKAKAEVKRAQNEFNIEKERWIKSKRTKLDKVIQKVLDIRREILLSSVVTISKIGLSALFLSVQKPLEGLVSGAMGTAGKAYTKLTGRESIFEMAPRHGRFDRKAEAHGIASLFTKAVLTDIKSIGKGNKSALEELYGKNKAVVEDTISWFGRSHAMIKYFPKHQEIERSVEYRLNWYKKNGYDIDSEEVQLRAFSEAISDGVNTIFMSDNVISDLVYRNAVNSLDKTDSGINKGISKVSQFILPIVKLPTNFVKESFLLIPGVAIADAAPVIMRVFESGVKNCDPKDADKIVFALKKSAIGLAAIMIGYYNPLNVGGYNTDDRDDKDVKAGTLRLFGKDLPKWFGHTPLFEIIQFGSTLRRLHDRAVNEEYSDSSFDKWAKPFIESSGHLVGEVPFLSTAGDISKAASRNEGWKSYFGNMAKGVLVPPDVQKIAKWQDTNEEGDVAKRKMLTVWDYVLSGAPNLSPILPLNSTGVDFIDGIIQGRKGLPLNKVEEDSKKKISSMIKAGESEDKIPMDLKIKAGFGEDRDAEYATFVKNALMDEKVKKFSNSKIDKKIKMWSSLSDKQKELAEDYLGDENDYDKDHLKQEHPELFKNEKYIKSYEELVKKFN